MIPLAKPFFALYCYGVLINLTLSPITGPLPPYKGSLRSYPSPSQNGSFLLFNFSLFIF